MKWGSRPVKVVSVIAATAMALTWLGYFFYAVGRGPTYAGAVFGALGAVTTLIALLAAAVTVWQGHQPYLAWKREQLRAPTMNVWCEWVTDRNEPGVRIGEHLDVDRTKVKLQVAIQNVGDRTLTEAVLNIVVLDECPIYEDSELGVDRVPRPEEAVVALNGEIDPGHVRRVRFFKEERNFPPRHIYIVRVEVILPNPRAIWPVMIVLDGEPNVSVVQRFDIRVVDED